MSSFVKKTDAFEVRHPHTRNSPIGEIGVCCQMLGSVNATRKFARQTLATVRDDFLDNLSSTAYARESITCFVDVIVC